MAYLIKMAWRNLGRHRGRTMLSLIAIVMGVFVVVIAKGVIDGIVDTFITYNINLNSGHLRIIQPEYKLKEQTLSLGYAVGNEDTPYSSIVEDIRSIPDVKVATGRIRFGMLLVARDDIQETVLGIGTDFDEEERITHLSRFFKDSRAGTLPRAGQREILLGDALMDKLDVGVGDKVNAVFSTSFGSLGLATFRVVGQMSSGLKFLDESVAYIPLDTAMHLLDMDDSVTEIVVFGETLSKSDTIKTETEPVLSTLPGNPTVIPWDEYSELISLMSQAKAIYAVIYILIVILASFVVFNTLLMVVSERTREIGMLAALGLTPRSIRRLFLIEGTILAVSGSFLGTLLGGVFNLWFGSVGLDISKMTENLGGEFLLTPRIYPTTGLSMLIFSFVLGVTVTIVAVYIPARHAG
ncbi:MAG: ABC transporter permease, partial [Firmicutes bacterium]|nr:ABC transporter permease [Bacillota bacterium]